MSLHGLMSVTIGVPNPGETGAYYGDFGLTPEGDGWYAAADAGRQLRIVPAPTRRLVEMQVGSDYPRASLQAAEAVGSLRDRSAAAWPCSLTSPATNGTYSALDRRKLRVIPYWR